MVKFNYFLSYSRDIYSEFIAQMHNKLFEIGINVWLDKFDVNIGDEIADNLYNMLDKSKEHQGVIFVFDKTFFHKKWCINELEYVLKNDIPFFPILYKIKKADIPPEYSFFKNYNLLSIHNSEEVNYLADRFTLLHLKNISHNLSKKTIIKSEVGKTLLRKTDDILENKSDILFNLDNFTQFLLYSYQNNLLELNEDIKFCIVTISRIKHLYFSLGILSEYNQVIIKKVLIILQASYFISE